MIITDIQKFIDEEINPILKDHGGFISIHEFDEKNKALKLKMGGGCQGCSGSKTTLRRGVENHLREEFPDLDVIEDVTDHLSGDSPYYSWDSLYL